MDLISDFDINLYRCMQPFCVTMTTIFRSCHLCETQALRYWILVTGGKTYNDSYQYYVIMLILADVSVGRYYCTSLIFYKHTTSGLFLKSVSIFFVISFYCLEVTQDDHRRQQRASSSPVTDFPCTVQSNVGE